MPDLDKVERNLPPAWRASYKLVKGEHHLEEVARAVLKVVTSTLRREGGVPRFGELVRVVQDRDAGLLDDRRLSSIAVRLEQRMDTRTGKLATLALQRPEVSGPLGALLGPPDERLVEELLVRMVESNLFSRQRDYLIGKRFTSRQDAIAFESDLIAVLRPHFAKLARRLVRKPSAEGLRAPSFPRSQKKSTAELLDQQL